MSAPKEIAALEAVGVAGPRPEPTDPASRVLDALSREWALTKNGTWGVIGGDLTADSLAEIEANYGPVEVLA